MSYREDYLFWQLVYALVKQKYRVLHFSMDQSEIWLENFTNKKFPIIRIKRENIDWSRWLREDIQHVFEQGEQIRKSALRNNLAILNIYVTQLPPVDSYEMWVGKRLEMNQQKTAVYPILLVGDNLGETIPEVTKILGFNPFKQVYTEYDYYDVEQMKNAALQEARQLEQKERELLNHSKPFFTYVFLSIQIIVFFLMEIAGGSLNPLVLLAFGAKYNPLIIEGEWWRFFTPIFLHIGFFHLLMNSLALYYLGTMVEKIYGNVRFLIIYLFAGFFGTLTSFMFTPNVSAGASGAIFGLFGALLYFGTVHKQVFFRTMGMNILFIIGINLVFGMIMPNIDNAGHIGGLIGGFLAAGIVHFPKNFTFMKQVLFFIVTIVIVAFSLFIGYQFPKF